MLASGRASIIGYTMPLWVVPLSMWLLKEPMTRRKLAGLALGSVGLILLVGDDLVRLQQAPLGTLSMLAAAVTWAIGIVIVKRYPVALPTTALMGWMMLMGGIPVLLGALLFGGTDVKPLSLKATIALVYVVFVAMVFCHWAFMRLVTICFCSFTFSTTLGVVNVGELMPVKSWVPCSSSSFSPGTPTSLMPMLRMPLSLTSGGENGPGPPKRIHAEKRSGARKTFCAWPT